MALKSNIPTLIKQYLKDHPDVTQKELAVIAGIKPSQLSRLLRSDPVQIDLRTIEALSEFIQFDLGNVIVEVKE
jgi:transcriptional regulator with XRE-family HTH domain